MTDSTKVKSQLRTKVKGAKVRKLAKKQTHLLAVKNASGKRTGKSARKEARTAQRAAAAAQRAAAEPKADEAMADAPKLRRSKGSRKKKQSSGAATGAHDAAGKSEAADAETMQQ